jgi:hypothetical protein
MNNRIDHSIPAYAEIVANKAVSRRCWLEGKMISSFVTKRAGAASEQADPTNRGVPPAASCVAFFLLHFSVSFRDFRG